MKQGRESLFFVIIFFSHRCSLSRTHTLSLSLHTLHTSQTASEEDLVIPPVLRLAHPNMAVTEYRKYRRDPLFLYKSTMICEDCWLVYAETSGASSTNMGGSGGVASMMSSLSMSRSFDSRRLSPLSRRHGSTNGKCRRRNYFCFVFFFLFFFCCPFFAALFLLTSFYSFFFLFSFFQVVVPEEKEKHKQQKRQQLLDKGEKDKKQGEI